MAIELVACACFSYEYLTNPSKYICKYAGIFGYFSKYDFFFWKSEPITFKYICCLESLVSSAASMTSTKWCIFSTVRASSLIVWLEPGCACYGVCGWLGERCRQILVSPSFITVSKPTSYHPSHSEILLLELLLLFHPRSTNPSFETADSLSGS